MIPLPSQDISLLWGLFTSGIIQVLKKFGLSEWGIHTANIVLGGLGSGVYAYFTSHNWVTAVTAMLTAYSASHAAYQSVKATGLLGG